MPRIHVSSLEDMPIVAADIGASRLITLLRADQAPPTPEPVQNANHLFVDINDINEPAEGLLEPLKHHVEGVIRFAKAWDQQAPMLVHCYAGISRSTAAAYISLCALNPDIDESVIADALRNASPTAYPNKLMISHADQLLGRNNRMIVAIEAIGRGEMAFTARSFSLPARFSAGI